MKTYEILRNKNESVSLFCVRVANEIQCMNCKILSFEITNDWAVIGYVNL